MSEIDAKLIERCRELVREIEAVEHALPPAGEILAQKLAEADQALTRFAAAPFRLPHFSGPGTVTRENVEFALLGVGMAMNPKAARAAIELAVRRGCAGGELRLGEPDKLRRLVELRGQLRVAEARVERNRREIEAGSGAVLDRTGGDPGIWVLLDADLMRVIDGKEPEELRVAREPDPDQPAPAQHAPGATAGRI